MEEAHLLLEPEEGHVCPACKVVIVLVIPELDAHLAAPLPSSEQLLGVVG